MNAARERGRRRIEKATAGLAALGVVVTGGAMALAYSDVASSVTANNTTTASTDSGSSTSAGLQVGSGVGSGSVSAQSSSS